MDVKASIVMKLGAEKCEVGLSCDAAPRAAIRTLVGRPNVKVKMIIKKCLKNYIIWEYIE